MRIVLRTHRRATCINGKSRRLAVGQEVERVCMVTLTRDVLKVTGLKHSDSRCFRDRDILRLCGPLPPPQSITRDRFTVMRRRDQKKVPDISQKFQRAFDSGRTRSYLQDIGSCELTSVGSRDHGRSSPHAISFLRPRASGNVGQACGLAFEERPSGPIHATHIRTRQERICRRSSDEYKIRIIPTQHFTGSAMGKSSASIKGRYWIERTKGK